MFSCGPLKNKNGQSVVHVDNVENHWLKQV